MFDAYLDHVTYIIYRYTTVCT